ncbi:MAG: serine/threonine-protein phosphatase [Lachnospiraceae bacterium]|nr:serine/threonine-protein phosphatase [Lachnospiraceae bacterium]
MTESQGLKADIKSARHRIMAFILMLALFACVFVVIARYGMDHVEHHMLFSIGYSMIAMLASVVLFLCCTLDGMQKDEERRLFMQVIFFNFACMTMDTISYFLDGLPQTRLFQTGIVAIQSAGNYLIYGRSMEYMVCTLQVKGERAVEFLRKLSRILMIAGILAGLSNLFYPLFFWVDEEGVYRETELYALDNIYPLFVSLSVFFFVIRFRKRLRKNQIIAALFYALSFASLGIIFGGVLPIFIGYAVSFLILFIMYILLNVNRNRKGELTRKELDTAKRIQEGSLARLDADIAEAAEFDIYALMKPCGEVGGDFYDFFRTDEDHFAFLVGDVAGKGVSAALFMSVARAMISMYAEMGAAPAEVLGDVNRRLVEQKGLNLTMDVWLGILDTRSGELVCCSAGKNRPAFLKKDLGPKFFLYDEAETTPLGKAADSVYADREMVFMPGERIFLYTDGLVDALSEKGRSGNEGLLETLNRYSDHTNEELCEGIWQSVLSGQGEAQQADDITMLGFSFTQYRREGGGE